MLSYRLHPLHRHIWTEVVDAFFAGPFATVFCLTAVLSHLLDTPL